MEFDTGFDYAGNPFNGNPYSNNGLLTPSLFNTSDYDFSNMLNFTPPIGNSQNAMSNMPGNSRTNMSNMPGDFVGGSEYPFPTQPTNTSQFSSAPAPTTAKTMAPAALSITSYSDFPQNELPPVVPHKTEPQLLNLQAKQEGERQSHEDPTIRSAGQKRAKSITSNANPDAGGEPKPKRRRGARKKVRTAEELAIKRENHLQRNRDAAQKCRQKKKLTEAEKKEQLVKERQNNYIVWNHVAMVQDELESFRNLAFDIDSSCDSDGLKTMTRAGLEKVGMLAAKLQDQIDMCNQRRAEIGQGLVMTRSFRGYVQQDSVQDGQESMQDGQSPAMSTQNSTYLPDHVRSNSYANSSVGDLPNTRSNGMGSRPMSRDSSYHTHNINTNFANGVNMSRKGSNDSPKQTDSAVDFNSPPGGVKKDLSVEDEAIENPMYLKDEPLLSLESMMPDANPPFSLLT